MDNDNSWISGIVPGDGLPVMADGFTDLVSLPSDGFNTLTRGTRLGKFFLLKGLKEGFAGSVLYQQLLRKEFDILVSLSHSAVVQAVGWENVPGLGWCIVEEYVDGLTLKAFLDTSPSRQERRKVADELIDALRYVHSKQVVHRDLKPANILVTANGLNVKIIDFGLSDTDAWTILKQPAGTRDYISPEQLETGVPDCRNDIYSLGLILQQLRAGAAYGAVARRCLRSAERRYPHMAALVADLETRRKRRRFAGTAAAIVVPMLLAAGALNAYYSVREQSLIALLSAERAQLSAERTRISQHSDSLLRAQAARATSPADTLTPPPVPAVASLPTNAPAATAARPDLNGWIAEGRRSMEPAYRQFLYSADTLSCKEYYDANFFTKLISDAVTIPADFRRKMEAELSPADAAIVSASLSTYNGDRLQTTLEKMWKRFDEND